MLTARALIAATLLVALRGVDAQRTYGPAGRPDRATLDSLAAKLPDSLRALARTMIESDSAEARANAGNRLEDHPEAIRFLFTIVPHDPAPIVRQYSIMNSYAFAHVQADSFARSTLAWMAVDDPDPAIAARALEPLRAFAIKPLRQLADQRMAKARTQGASAVTASARIEDDWVNLDHGMVMPSFTRIAPDPFVAVPASERSLRILAFGD